MLTTRVNQLRNLCDSFKFEKVPTDQQLEKMLQEIGENPHYQMTRAVEAPFHVSRKHWRMPWKLTVSKDKRYFKPGKHGSSVGLGTTKDVKIAIDADALEPAAILSVYSERDFKREVEIKELMRAQRPRGRCFSSMNYIGSSKGSSVDRHEIIEPFAKQGDLFTFMMDGPQGQLDRHLYDILRTITLDLKALHDIGYAHRDVKPENILVMEDHEGIFGQLSDFGFAVERDDELRLEGGTRLYLPLEAMVHECEHRDMYQAVEEAKLGDIYALGLVFYSLLTKEFTMFQAAVDTNGAMTAKELESYAKSSEALVRKRIEGTSGKEAILLKLVSRMISRVPEKRPSLDEILAGLDFIATV